MRGLQKSKRVSWASDLNLCQVKLFLSDESPSQVGLGGQDHLQAKASWPCYSAGGSDDNLPPGFEGIQPANLLHNKLSQVPVIQWKCPSRFVLDANWQVAAGEESKEVNLESQREMRVLEAIYPRPSAIPPNPASPMNADDSYYNDLHTPLIPITPIEDEDLPPPDNPSSSSSNGMPPPAVEPDVVTAAYSALNAAMSNNSPGSLIDPSLLIKILSNPDLIEKLVSSTTHGSSTSTSTSTSAPQTLPMPTNPTHGPPVVSVSLPEPPLPVHPRPTHLPYSTPSSSNASHYQPPPPPPTSRVGPVHVPVSNMGPPQHTEKKDINYYKSLIQQHGGEKAETGNNGMKVKQKINKPCIYYNSSRGCRHGASCVFQHDASAQQRVTSSLPEAQSAKRMKMDREITGT